MMPAAFTDGSLAKMTGILLTVAHPVIPGAIPETSPADTNRSGNGDIRRSSGQRIICKIIIGDAVGQLRTTIIAKQFTAQPAMMTITLGKYRIAADTRAIEVSVIRDPPWIAFMNQQRGGANIQWWIGILSQPLHIKLGSLIFDPGNLCSVFRSD